MAIIRQVLVEITQTHQECVYSPKPDSVIICEEQVENLLISYVDATIVDNKENTIVKISEAFVSYFYEESLVLIDQTPQISSPPSSFPKDASQMSEDQINHLVETKLENSIK